MFSRNLLRGQSPLSDEALFVLAHQCSPPHIAPPSLFTLHYVTIYYTSFRGRPSSDGRLFRCVAARLRWLLTRKSRRINTYSGKRRVLPSFDLDIVF